MKTHNFEFYGKQPRGKPTPRVPQGSEVPFPVVLGGVTYKILIFDPKAKVKQAKPAGTTIFRLVPLWLCLEASLIVQEIFYFR
jgi:hypothetical protein